MLASPMLLEGSEWLIVVLLVGAILVFGPDKIPQIAKQIGRAKSEFDKASTEAKGMIDTAMKSVDQEASGATGTLSSTISDIRSSFESTAKEMKSSFDSAVTAAQTPALPPGGAEPPASTAPAVSSPPPATPEAPPAMANEVDADALLKLAHRMGIETAGKTRDEISEEIFSRSGSQAKP